MKVEKGKFVRIEYEVYLEGENNVLDSGTLTYLHGNGEILPALEKRLEGAQVGEILDITLPPSEAFGEFDKDLVREIPLDYFEDKDIKPGQFVRAQTLDGSILQFTVIDVSEGIVYADFNHPLAGETLRFKIKVLGVSDEKPPCECGGGCNCQED
jgi:FKBP-type peptidyl-prolyl cis-trans isomerase SlyD